MRAATRRIWAIVWLPLGCLAAPLELQKTVQPFLATYCVLCHNATLKTAGLDLHAPSEHDEAVWEHVLQKLRTGQMPPKGLPRPKAEEVEAVTRWIETLLGGRDRTRLLDPGRVTARRLNRFEYNQTIQDLLAIDFRPADDFPADDSGYGFDNIGDVLSLSPVLMEKYLAAAEKIARLAIAAEPPMKPTLERYRADKLEQVGPVLQAKHRFLIDAEYELRTGLGGRRYGPEHLKVAIWLDNRQVKLFDVEVARGRPRVLDVRIPVKAGEHLLKAEVLYCEPKPDDLDARSRERNVVVDHLEIRGPFQTEPQQLPESYWRLFVCGHTRGRHQPVCAGHILMNLARRAWRRPVNDAEIDALTRFVTLAQKQGDSFEQGLRVALEAILVSPHFLFRIERDPNPNSPEAVHPINDFELASRLSYFLWSSMPDEELFHCAAAGTLRQPGGLEAQVRRMLLDARSSRLVENFAGQWLELRNLDAVKPDADRFPDFDEELRQAMRRETLLFFESIVREDRSILDFIDGQYTFLNERLARHYGIPGVEGKEFHRVVLTGRQRSGVLTQAGILTVTSYPNRTSPVLRGKWLLENILGAPPPPPPPDAGILDESQVNVSGTVREQFEKHRSQASCAACHARMDPLGFAFENYDAIGRWRTREGKFQVDASGTLPDGTSFQGASGLKAILKTQRNEFSRCLAEKMLTYALGRGLERYDRPAVDEICRKMAENDYRFSSLILGIVHSMPFQMRRGEAVQTTTRVARRGN